MKPVPVLPPFPTRAEIVRGFGEIAKEFAATRTSPWPETAEFAARLPQRARVLDLGCGNGRNLKFLHDRGHPVVGLDASGALLALAAERGCPILIRGDVVNLPFEDSAFDAVHCVATLHHLPSEAERLDALREAGRVLRPGGVLLASVWALDQRRLTEAVETLARHSQDTGQDWNLPWVRSDGRVFPRFYHLFRSGELDGIVRDAGMSVIESQRSGDNYVVLAARR